MRPVIPPFATRSGSLWAGLPPFKLILYPYVDGRHGYAGKLSPEQWSEFGAALKQLHTARIPADLTRGIPREDFSSRWRTSVKAFLEGIRKEAYTEPIAAEMAAFLKARAGETLALVRRAEHCLQILQQRPSEFVLCHADIHGWNLLVNGRGALYIVDWDTLLFAPKERDLMFIGAGLADSGYTPQEEEVLFYRGYGRTEIDRVALAYYRSERVIEDIAVFCEQIFSSDAGGADREQALEYLKSNFLPGGTIEMADRTEL
jgi:spectinomycin phosphotransferase